MILHTENNEKDLYIESFYSKRMKYFFALILKLLTFVCKKNSLQYLASIFYIINKYKPDDYSSKIFIWPDVWLHCNTLHSFKNKHMSKLELLTTMSNSFWRTFYCIFFNWMILHTESGIIEKRKRFLWQTNVIFFPFILK